MLKSLKAFVYVMALIAFAAGSAHACACHAPKVEDSFRDAAAVFQGSVRDDGRAMRPDGTRFKVERAWKGVEFDEVTVKTVANSCGQIFEGGETYVVFAFLGPEGELGTVACSNTMELEAAGAQLSYLAGKETIKLSPAPPGYWYISVVTGLVVTLCVSVGYLVRSFSRRAA